MLPESARKRKTLLAWGKAGLDAVDAGKAVRKSLSEWRGPAAVLAMGKAAVTMAMAAESVLGADMRHGLAIFPTGYGSAPSARWKSRCGGHPIPTELSIQAGDALVEWLHGLPPGLPVLVLLSGGSSAAVELPVPGLSLEVLRDINRWLLGSGLDIHDINAIRSRFSQLKRGGLLRFTADRPVVGLVVSDVPGDDFVHVGSGPLAPAPVSWPARLPIPEWLTRIHKELPLPGKTPENRPADMRLIASNGMALDAIEGAAAAAGYPLIRRGDLSGDAAEAGLRLAREIKEGPAGVYLYGGETTVILPPDPGRGGRNQHLALAAARELAGVPDALLLALATDGIDGNSEDAGALVDGGSVSRIREAGLDAQSRLTAADSNIALCAAGDVIHTGPTGTNVMDLVIGWKLQ